MAMEWNENFMPDLRAKVVGPALNAGMIAAEGYARRNMQRIAPRITKAGVFFGKRHKGGREIHRSAPPGTFPNVRTGNLRNSIVAGLATPDQPVLTGSVGVYSGRKIRIRHKSAGPGTRGYARWLEFGTRRMKARPFLRPTVENAPIFATFERASRRLFNQRMGAG